MQNFFKKTICAYVDMNKNKISTTRISSFHLMQQSLGLFVFQRVTEWKRTFLFLPATVSYQPQQ